MTRKIIPIGTLMADEGGSISIPAGSRLLSVRGEASGKTTYDFTVSCITYTSNGSSLFTNTINIRYVGTRNGGSVKCGKDWPICPTVTAAPVASTFNNGPAATRLTIVGGTGVTLQAYIATGLTSVQ